MKPFFFVILGSLSLVLFFNPGAALSANSSNYALELDGNDNINCNFNLPQSYTKELWINIDKSWNRENNLISGADGHAFWASKQIVAAGHNGKYHYVYEGRKPANSLGTTAGLTTDGIPIEAGWQHYAVTYDAATTTMKLFKNGSLIDVNTNVPPYTGNGQVQIGSFRNNYFVKGSIDEVRIWNYARSEADILASMTCELAGTEQGLAAYYPFNKGDAVKTGANNIIIDQSLNRIEGTLRGFNRDSNPEKWGTGCPRVVDCGAPPQADLPAGTLVFAEIRNDAAYQAKGFSYGGEVQICENYCPPSSEAWTATSTPPERKDNATAVWTGYEMIVWGGGNPAASKYITNTGERYNPTTDTWTPTSMSNAPPERYLHVAVWTGTEMIIWGGTSKVGATITPLNSGGIYNPSTDSWRSMSTTGAPTMRQNSKPAVVWTGTEMIVYGQGTTSTFEGAKYNPSSNTWNPINTTGGPGVSPTQGSAPVAWTGSEMFVIGSFNAGKYNLSTDTWERINIPSNSRSLIPYAPAATIWTGTEILMWGSMETSSPTNNGVRYNPSANTWTAMSTANAPSSRTTVSPVWTGSEMIVWGGGQVNSYGTYYNTGGRYNPSTNTWVATLTTGAPDGRRNPLAVWTGCEMIVFGGFTTGAIGTGGKYTTGLSANPTVYHKYKK